MSGAVAGVGGIAFSGRERALVKWSVRGRRSVRKGMGRTWGGKGREYSLGGHVSGARLVSRALKWCRGTAYRTWISEKAWRPCGPGLCPCGWRMKATAAMW